MKKLPKPLTAEQLKPDKWYYCNETFVMQDVQFLRIENFGILEGYALVGFKGEDGAWHEWYVRIESLFKRSE